MNDKQAASHLKGVNCTVTTCSHHGDNNTCHADDIKVGTEYAEDKGETFCSTFKHRP